MIDKLKKILEDGEQRIAQTLSETELQDVKASLLGKQSVFTEVMKEMPKLDPKLRPEIGKKVNEIKSRFTSGDRKKSQ